ncbi:MAG: hypothetical protein JKY19_00695 [Alcanivoracaceae bacterium]|nr:hypothetical protein [Alcanivoracaceae bacterium]
MRSNKTVSKILLITILLNLIVHIPSLLMAQSSGGNFEIKTHTIGNGGGLSVGGNFSLNGTIGQADAHTSENDTFKLEGGFWPHGNSQSDLIYQNGFED